MKPEPFSKPGDYIEALAEEFYHQCVYCLMPNAFGGSFEVEHYRPESRFKDLRTEYSNLFYACRACNGRKGSKWVEPAPGGAYIVNPCQDAMAEHLWYETIQVEPRSKAGAFTEETLRLNDAARIEARARIDFAIAEIWTKLVGLRKRRKKLLKALNAEQNPARKKKMEVALACLDADDEKRVNFLRFVVRRQSSQVKL